MTDVAGAGASAHEQRRLAKLAQTPLNFERSSLGTDPPTGWTVEDVRHSLPSEPPGAPESDGSWEVARQVISDYRFAPPSIVRAYFDPAAPLVGRDMLLRLRALGLVQVYVGVRILEVIDDTREVSGRSARVWGWTYGTLEGHVERGEMSWEVWKWLDSGAVDFRVHAVSRPAPIGNLAVRFGFKIVGGHERAEFLSTAQTRMERLVEESLSARQNG